MNDNEIKKMNEQISRARNSLRQLDGFSMSDECIKTWKTDMLELISSAEDALKFAKCMLRNI